MATATREDGGAWSLAVLPLLDWSRGPGSGAGWVESSDFLCCVDRGRGAVALGH